MEEVQLEKLKSRKRKERVFIVGGGPSLKDFNFSSLANEDTIVVNSAFLNVPNSNYFVTVDFTFVKKRYCAAFQNLSAFKVFVADFSYPFLKEIGDQIVDTRYDLPYYLEDFDFVIKAKFQEGVGFDWENFRTGKNSGFCALQLAVLLGYSEIYLLGFDLRCSEENTHFHEGYGEPIRGFKNKLSSYYPFFIKALGDLSKKQIPKVFSCSKISLLNSIIPFKEFNEVI